MFSAKVLLDSAGASSRLTTMLITYPRCIHAEMLRHRVFSRNTASSRAIPIRRMIRDVIEHPFVPVHWGLNQKGMQSGSELDPGQVQDAKAAWLFARDLAVNQAERMFDKFGLHKQLINRLLEPFAWTTEVITGTRWSNFFALRCHEAAEPHIQIIAGLMRDALDASVPAQLLEGEWHIPMGEPGLMVEDQLKIATGRCARTSYLTHDGIRNVAEDIDLHARLMVAGHWSPFEHCAQHLSLAGPGAGGNLGSGWLQYRKTFEGECR
jgi:hypothetical protein